MKEIWKDIAGYEGLYQVSNLGRVKHLGYWREWQSKNQYTTFNTNYYVDERVLVSCSKPNHYLHVGLYVRGVGVKNYCVHRLVAETFIDRNNFKSMPYEDRSKVDLDKLEVNHKDENKHNNCVSNLEWCTGAYNATYGKSQKIRLAKWSKRTGQYDLNFNLIKVWDSVRSIDRELGFSRRVIAKCCKGNCKSAFGYIWKYMDEVIENENNN